MAKVYLPPKEFILPKLFTNNDDRASRFTKYDKECDLYLAKISEYCKSESKCPDAGEVIWWVIGDGSATYVVYDYRTLIYIGTNDGYTLPESHERGIRKADIILKVKSNKLVPPMDFNP
jgi:hypothetical protein